MTNISSGKSGVTPNGARFDRTNRARACLRIGLVAALGVASALFPPASPRAQRTGEQGASVKDVSTTRRGGETTVSISGEGSMNRVQTWQDRDGFHVVFPGGKGGPGRLPAGVRAQRVGDSLELVVPTRPGSTVTVQPRAGRLDLVVNGGIDEGGGVPQSRAQEKSESRDSRSREQAGRERQSVEDHRAQDGAGSRSAGGDSVQRREKGPPEANPAARSNGANDAGQPPATQGGAPRESQSSTSPDTTLKAPEAGAQPAEFGSAQTKIELDEGGWPIFSVTGLLMLSGVTGVGVLLLFVRRRAAGEASGARAATPKKKGASAPFEGARQVESFELPPFEPYKGDRRKRDLPVAHDRRRGDEATGRRFSVSNGALMPEGALEKIERRGDARTAGAGGVPAVLFGAYRIDQEVAKLVQGLPHSIEVLASRASDDRRAIETSLVKALNSHETCEDGARRVRQALEDYGFVARQSAALLLSSDSYERVSSARVLGQVRAAVSLPFLLEALYDAEPVVRTEAVSSLGALGRPKAIGALIDMARRYPEVPASLLAPALTACSFEAQEWAWVSHAESRMPALEGAAVEDRAGEIATYDAATQVEQLPEWLEDENLADALERLDSADVEARISAAQSLAQFPVRRSVDALTAILVRDGSAAVRAAAVTSLGAIDHESVFAPVLYALADDSREVCAAAARAYSGVNFERSDAAARLVETADRETLEDLARACVKSGVVAQSIDRLASEDRRHAYEAFSLLSLVIRGGETEKIVDAVANHRDTGVRLAAVRLASLTGDPGLQARLRELADEENTPRAVREAITEAFEGAQLRR